MLTLGGHYGKVKGGYNGNWGYNGPKAGDNMVMADTMVHDERRIYKNTPDKSRFTAELTGADGWSEGVDINAMG